MINFLNGYKTYILAAAGFTFNALAAKHWLPASIDQSHFVGAVDWLLGFAGMATLRSGIAAAAKP